MGTLFVVATPIGNLDDFSPRAIETLKQSDLILVEDTRQTIKLLNHFDIKTKMVSYHKYNEKERANEVVNDLKQGKNISLVSDAGTPCISDPGYILIKKAREENINVIGIPGPSAVTTALSVSGLDSSSFTFYGFVPTITKDKKQLFHEIRHSKVKTKIVYESPKRILKLLEEVKEEIPGCIVCVCNELTKVHEHAIYGKINDVYEKMVIDSNAQKGEYVVLISNEPVIKVENDNVSLEALIINEMKNKNCTLKDAVKLVADKFDEVSKKDVYNASLNLKKMLDN